MSTEENHVANRFISMLLLKQTYMESSSQEFSSTATIELKDVSGEETQAKFLRLAEEDERDFVYESHSQGRAQITILQGGIPWIHGVSRSEFEKDLALLCELSLEAEAIAYADERLKRDELKYKVFNKTERHDRNLRWISIFDFKTVFKIENHEHTAGSAAAFILREEIILKWNTPDLGIVWIDLSGEGYTLTQILGNVNVKTPDDLTLKKLDVKADSTCWRNFPNFRLKYCPCGLASLRETFLKIDNRNEGSWFAGLLDRVTANVKAKKNEAVELRLTIHGVDPMEWKRVAIWFKTHVLKFDDKNCINWMVQIKSLSRTKPIHVRDPSFFNMQALHYAVTFSSPEHHHKQHPSGAKNTVKSFGEMLRNIFDPIFENTMMKESEMGDEDKALRDFLSRVSGFDLVGEEPCNEIREADLPDPDAWTTDTNPPYYYQLYYAHDNLSKLNYLRRQRKMNTFALRPHAGETGNYCNLSAAFLLAESIAHGVTLERYAPLVYLYKMSQMGITMAPTSNAFLCHRMSKHPLKRFLKKGLRITVGADDPMQFCDSENPLMEEYLSAEKAFGLSDSELSELARNSILISAFSDEQKATWSAPDCIRSIEKGEFVNDEKKTNVSNARILFRQNTLLDEWKALKSKL